MLVILPFRNPTHNASLFPLDNSSTASSANRLAKSLLLADGSPHAYMKNLVKNVLNGINFSEYQYLVRKFNEVLREIETVKITQRYLIKGLEHEFFGYVRYENPATHTNKQANCCCKRSTKVFGCIKPENW